MKKIMIIVITIFSLFLLINCHFCIITSGSMEPNIKVGSLVVVSKQSNYNCNDIITYTLDDLLITHRLISYEDNEWITKGDANNSIDPWQVRENQIIGKVIFHIPYLGYLLALIKNYGLFLILLYLCINLIKRFSDKVTRTQIFNGGE